MSRPFGRDVPDATPLHDYSGLKLKWVQTQEQLNEAEFVNCLKATTKYLARRPTRRMAPFTCDWMLRLHREMFGDVWVWAGVIRRTDEFAFGLRVRDVEAGLEELARDLTYWRDQEGDTVEQAALLHHRSVHIHPFRNGNGRWARLLANIWAMQNGGSVVSWPEEGLRQQTSAIRAGYIQAIKDADAGDIASLVALHRRYASAL